MPLALYCFFSVAQPVCAAADTSRLKVQTNVMIILRLCAITRGNVSIFDRFPRVIGLFSEGIQVLIASFLKDEDHQGQGDDGHGGADGQVDAE